MHLQDLGESGSGVQECVLLGKPAPTIYKAAMQLLGLNDPKEIIAIGDSLEHDIAGMDNSTTQHPVHSCHASGMCCQQLR